MAPVPRVGGDWGGKTAALVAHGITAGDKRTLLGIVLHGRESGDARTSLLANTGDRRLASLALVTHGGDASLVKGVEGGVA